MERKQPDMISQNKLASTVRGEGETMVQSTLGRLKSLQRMTGTLCLTAHNNEVQSSSR